MCSLINLRPWWPIAVARLNSIRTMHVGFEQISKHVREKRLILENVWSNQEKHGEEKWHGSDKIINQLMDLV